MKKHIYLYTFLFLSFNLSSQLDSSKNSKLDSIRNLSIKEILVTEKKDQVEYKDGKTIFSIENSVNKSGLDVFSILKKIPGVNATNNGISIAGKNSVSILINGRLQQMSMEDLISQLRSMQSDQVSKIELNTQPSSKYDAEGNTGLINIILKKNPKEGLRGSVSNMAYFNHLFGGSIATNLNYRKNKFNYSINASIFRMVYQYHSWNYSPFEKQYWKYDILESRFANLALLNGGIEYNITPKTIINATVATNRREYNTEEESRGFARDYSENLDSTNFTTGKTLESYPYKLNSSLSLEHKFDTTGSKMNVEYNFFILKSDRDRMFSNFGYDNLGIQNSLSENRIKGIYLTRIHVLKSDFEFPTKLFKIDFGYKFSFVNSNANNLFYFNSNSKYLLDTTRSNEYNYDEKIQAAYIMLSKKWNKLDIQLGLRTERTDAIGSSNTINQTSFQDYFNIFPTLNLSYSINDNNTVSIFSTRRIKRPDYGNLNPFKYYYSPQSYAVGNPALVPTTNWVTELSYSYKSNIRAQLAYNHNFNYFDRVFILDTSTNTSKISRYNIGETDYIGLQISYNYSPVKWWEFYGSMNCAWNQFSPFAEYGYQSYSRLNAWFELYQTF